MLPAPAHLDSLARDLFGERRVLAEQYAEILRTRGVEEGLIGPREVDRIWERHVINCALMVRALGPAGLVESLADVGSGAGLPGLVIAIAREDIDVTLIETMQRRVDFLERAVEELDLVNVEVVRARAEDLHGEREFDAVTARAVAALDKLAKWTVPLVRIGGELVVMKGKSARDEIVKAEKTLARLGACDVRVEEFGDPSVEVPTTVVRAHVREVSGRKGPRRG